MTRIRFRDLTPEQVAWVCNGCGAKGHWLDPPDWLYQASCDHHDFNYWLGGTELDRRRADDQFLSAMMADADRATWWKRPWLRFVAWTYFRAVRAWGSSAFHYGEERGLEDLLEEMGCQEASG